MTTRKTPAAAGKRTALPVGYAGIHGGIVELLDAARQAAARSVNALMTASYWEIGRRIVEAEQKGRRRAGYGEQLMERLSADLTTRFGRGFSPDNLENMRRFFVAYPLSAISETLSRKSGAGLPIENSETMSRKFDLSKLAQVFTLPWSAYVRLLSVRMTMPASSTRPRRCAAAGACANSTGRLEASSTSVRPCPKTRRRCWSGAVAKPEDAITPNDAIKDPYVLEFLDLKDEYSESDLEAALIQRLEYFLLELGEGFTFVGRQRRLRIDQTWYRVDLLFFHRKLHCLVIVDLKLGSLTHADVGQMHMYCNYAKEHWAYPDENPPVGLILCADKGHALARYALDGLPNKVMAANYRTVLPDAELLQRAGEHAASARISRNAVSQRRQAVVVCPGVPPSGSWTSLCASCRITAIRH